MKKFLVLIALAFTATTAQAELTCVKKLDGTLLCGSAASAEEINQVSQSMQEKGHGDSFTRTSVDKDVSVVKTPFMIFDQFMGLVILGTIIAMALFLVYILIGELVCCFLR